MIASLSGSLKVKSPEEVVIDCGGVGYGVIVPMSTYGRLPDVGAAVELHVHTHVREDALQLFGFASRLEKRLFLKLISISGIGPKLAVGLMSGVSAEDLVAAIAAKDVKRLTLVPGIGKKTAERIVLELSDKLLDLGVPVGRLEKAAPPRPARSAVKEDVVSALVNLGYKPVHAEDVVGKVPDGDFELVLREALRSLAPA